MSDWNIWDLFVTCLHMAQDANSDPDGIPVPFIDGALRADAESLYGFLTENNRTEIDRRMQAYGMIQDGTVDERIDGARELLTYVADKTGI